MGVEGFVNVRSISHFCECGFALKAAFCIAAV